MWYAKHHCLTHLNFCQGTPSSSREGVYTCERHLKRLNHVTLQLLEKRGSHSESKTVAEASGIIVMMSLSVNGNIEKKLSLQPGLVRQRVAPYLIF